MCLLLKGDIGVVDTHLSVLGHGTGSMSERTGARGEDAPHLYACCGKELWISWLTDHCPLWVGLKLQSPLVSFLGHRCQSVPSRWTKEETTERGKNKHES